MLYLGLAMAISFVSVLLPAIIGAAIGSKKVGRAIIIGMSLATLYGLALWLIYWLAAAGIYGPTPLFWEIFVGVILGTVATYFSEDKDYDYSSTPWGLVPGLLVVGVYIFYAVIIVSLFEGSSMFNAREKAKLIGRVEEIADISEAMDPVDQAHICQVSEGMAKVKADAALSKFKVAGDVVPGSRYKVGAPTKQYVDGQVWWIFPVEFQGWLKWRQDKQSPGYLRISAENPFEEAQAVQYNKFGEEIHIRYLKSACFEYRADRYLRYHGYLGRILQDWTFEVDDDWNPYYTVSVMERTFAYAGYRLSGIIVFNVQNGQLKFCKSAIPDWVDRAFPLNALDWQIRYWGLYGKAGWWYTLWHDDKSQMPTPGWYLTYGADGRCQWFSGFTSTTAAEKAMTGFALSDARTGQTKFYKAKGVTEERAYETAASLWNLFREYEPKELVVYNIYGVLTYVIPMEYRGQFKGISLTTLHNIDINAKGFTLEEALNNYRVVLSRSRSESLAPTGGQLEQLTLKGYIERVGITLTQGQQQIFPFMLAGMPKIFQVVYSYEASPEAPMMQVGDLVAITFVDTKEKVITCDTFDISSVEVTDESPTQARHLEERAKVGTETERIRQEERRENLLQSERMKKVNPKALEEFLKNQGQ